jgi:hypothetical protein
VIVSSTYDSVQLTTLMIATPQMMPTAKITAKIFSCLAMSSITFRPCGEISGRSPRARPPPVSRSYYTWCASAVYESEPADCFWLPCVQSFFELPMTREGAEISAGATAVSHRQA